ncbi:MAG: hypothetical protein H5U38_09875 [Calditrichaeota bacterium]|nr:hypothetical protein [Calditrichota bacterium]
MSRDQARAWAASLFALVAVLLLLGWPEDLRAQPVAAGAVTSPDSLPPRQLPGLDGAALLGPRPAPVLVGLPFVFLHVRGAPGQWLAFSALGSTPRETGLFVEGLDLRDPISSTVDVHMLPTYWLSAIHLETTAATWGTPRGAAGAALSCSANRHTGQRPLSHVGYENGDWGVRAVDVALGMKVSPKADVLAGALLAGFEGFALRQEHDAQRIRATASAALTDNWSATYVALLTKTETEETPDPRQLALRLAAYPVRKDRRLDHALTLCGTLGRPVHVQANVTHTDLRREFHDYPLRLRWMEESHVLSLASSASVGGQKAAGLVGASVRYAQVESEVMGTHTDVEASLRCGLRTEPGKSWHLQFLCDGLVRQDTHLFLAPSLQVVRRLRANSWVEVHGSREVFFPSFAERYGQERVWGDRGLRPWAVHRVMAGLSSQGAHSAFYVGGFVRHGAREVVQHLGASGDSLFFTQAAGSHRLAGLTASFSAEPVKRSFLRCWVVAQTPLLGDQRLAELPSWHGWLTAGYGLSLFNSDLELTAQLFCQLLGDRYDANIEHRLSPLAVPGAEATARIMRNAVVWVRMENLLGLVYQTTWGYPMPTRFFTWGVNWSFVD